MNKYKLFKNINVGVAIISMFLFVLFIFSNSPTAFNPELTSDTTFLNEYYTLIVGLVNDVRQVIFLFLSGITIAMALIYSLGFLVISKLFKYVGDRNNRLLIISSIALISILQLIFGLNIISTFIFAQYIINFYYFINVCLLLLLVIAMMNLVASMYIIYKKAHEIKIDYYVFATAILKVLAILLLVIVSFDIVFSIFKYIIAIVVVSNLEITTLISVSNLFNLDFSTPFAEYNIPIVLDYFNQSNVDMSQSLADFGITNQVVDQLLADNVFVYVDQIIKNMILSISRYFIFDNLVLNIFGFIFSSISLIVTSDKIKYMTKFSDYIVKLVCIVILFILYVLLIDAFYNIFIYLLLIISALSFIYLIIKNNDTIKLSK